MLLTPFSGNHKTIHGNEGIAFHSSGQIQVAWWLSKIQTSTLHCHTFISLSYRRSFETSKDCVRNMQLHDELFPIRDEFTLHVREVVVHLTEAQYWSIGHVRYINIRAWLRGFRVKIANFQDSLSLNSQRRLRYKENNTNCYIAGVFPATACPFIG